MNIALPIIVLVLLSGLRIAQEYQRGVVFRLGRVRGLRGPGLFWIIPIGIESTWAGENGVRPQSNSTLPRQAAMAETIRSVIP